MDRDKELYRQIDQMERERQREERKAKWAKRERSFWKAFLFTEDGKPKSGLLVYTFCLSLVYVVLYIAAFHFVIDWLTPVTTEWPALAGNLVQSLAVGAAVALLSLALHRIFSEKRLMFGCHLWLAAYGLLVCVSMLFLLGDGEVFAVFLHFFAWFILIPVASGLIVTYLLYRKDYMPPKKGEDAPWKKYTQRR